jgi:pimeloyl-ACP methyl ester carboxylesterase
VVRSALTWRLLDEDLVGTCHLPEGPTRNPSAPPRSRVGFLLLNAGPAPRAGNSDLSVHLGDRLAWHGFPVFRFDLPGLGDSSGRTPLDLDSYWSEVLEGRNDEATLALIRRIRREFGLSGVIVGGLCAAAVPALRAAARDAGAVPGVLLLEPNLRWATRSIPGRPGTDPSVAPTRGSALRKVLSRREWLLFLTGESWIARAAGPLRASLLRALKRSEGHTLPKGTNVPLVMRWQGSLSQGVHALVVVAEGQGTDLDMDRIIESLPARSSGAVSCVHVPDTNHLFTSGSGRDAVLLAVERWVLRCFGGDAAAPGENENHR